MADERARRGSFLGAAVIGGVAGAALGSRLPAPGVLLCAVAGAAVLGVADAVARARQRPAEIPALWSRILASGFLLR